MKNKIIWLSILQGWSMLLVVIGHVSLTNIYRDPSTPISSEIERIIYSFHMPLFIFISGWLFYYTCIGKEKPYLEVIISKFKRLGIPFIAFTIFTTIIKIIFSPWMKRKVDFEEIINTFILFKSNPLGEMWFIITLLILMLMYPIYKKLIDMKIPFIIIFLSSIYITYIFPNELNYFQINNVIKMLPYFLLGIYTCKNQIIQQIQVNTITLIIATTLFILSTFIDIGILQALSGIYFSIIICLKTSTVKPSLFNSFRNYTFQIFLLGIFIQMSIRYIYLYINSHSLYIPLYCLSIFLGIYIPVWISKLIEKKGNYIKYCLGL